jgi:hypothetical protein
VPSLRPAGTIQLEIIDLPFGFSGMGFSSSTNRSL